MPAEKGNAIHGKETEHRLGEDYHITYQNPVHKSGKVVILVNDQSCSVSSNTSQKLPICAALTAVTLRELSVRLLKGGLEVLSRGITCNISQ